MQLVNWILLFLATLFGYLDSMKATSLSQDTIRDEAYQLYPLGIACRNNDLETIKRLLAGKDEPMAMGNDCYEFDILYTAIYFNKKYLVPFMAQGRFFSKPERLDLVFSLRTRSTFALE